MPQKFYINSFQLKVLALIIMTIDHIGAFGLLKAYPEINETLRIIGRASAPIFLFLATEAMRHTRSKPKYILRLYFAGAAVQIANTIMLATAASGFPEGTFGNILPTLFYMAFYVYCIEAVINNRKKRRAVLPAVLGMLAPVVFSILDILLFKEDAAGLRNAFLPSLFGVEYSFLFSLIGVAWYFAEDKYISCVIFAAVCALSALVPFSWFFSLPEGLKFIGPDYFNGYALFFENQWYMVMAIPLILLYNGKKGRNMKPLFYLYYPLHQYALFAAYLLME